MRGIPEFNFPAFFAAEERFAEQGWIVVNPARIDQIEGYDPGWSQEVYMRRDLRLVPTCDAIALLPGWRSSDGARKELSVARWCGLAVLDAETMAPLPDETVLEEAQRLVHGDRGDAYGPPTTDFARTGRMWGAILGIPDVAPEKVGLCMSALKISRECNKPSRENRVDGAGYWETVDMIEQRKEASNEPA
jgi:hypothetical protein